MGLVMQEPTLFNYSIKDNILYGKDIAKNSKIRNSAAIANALEFIETEDLPEKKHEMKDLLDSYKDQ